MGRGRDQEEAIFQINSPQRRERGKRKVLRKNFFNVSQMRAHAGEKL